MDINEDVPVSLQVDFTDQKGKSLEFVHVKKY